RGDQRSIVATVATVERRLDGWAANSAEKPAKSGRPSPFPNEATRVVEAWGGQR
ncbi:MAG: hypothetical protein QOD57_4329, partial [Actinomycetota bacterium]|nr:hypothetical protein [Actinomycetota bacterium]